MFFLFNAPVSILGVLLAAVVSIVIGMVWYSPKVFGTKWLQLRGKTKEELKSSPTDMVYATLGALATALVLAIFIGYAMMGSVFTAFIGGFMSGAQGAAAVPTMILSGSWSPVVIGIVVALLAWLGFVIPTALNEVIWEGRNKKLFMFNMAHLLVSLVVMAIVYILVSGGIDMAGIGALG